MKGRFSITWDPPELPALAFIALAICLMPGASLAQNKRANMEANKKMVQKAFDKWANSTGDFFDLLSENVVWTITGSSPISKTYTGRKQFMDEVIVPLNDRLAKRIVPKLRGLYADGDMVIALWDGKAMARDGIAYNNTYSWFMRMKEEKLLKWWLFSTQLTGRYLEESGGYRAKISYFLVNPGLSPQLTYKN